jgi:hypothetical protein
MPITISGTTATFNDSSTVDTGNRFAVCWVNWNPQNSTIRSSYGVSSVSGYTVNFSTTLPSSNYGALQGHSNAVNDGFARQPWLGLRSTTQGRFDSGYGQTTMSLIVYR